MLENSCLGCNLKKEYCSITKYNTINNKCPCVDCLVKTMCNFVCKEREAFLDRSLKRRKPLASEYLLKRGKIVNFRSSEVCS